MLVTGGIVSRVRAVSGGRRVRGKPRLLSGRVHGIGRNSGHGPHQLSWLHGGWSLDGKGSDNVRLRKEDVMKQEHSWRYRKGQAKNKKRRLVPASDD